MTRRTSLVSIVLASLVAMLPSAVMAQAPDIRSIRPDVILLVDTSGSMDYAMGSASGPAGQLPVCTNSAASPSQRSRWTSLVEALTGTFGSDYYCTNYDRRVQYPGAPDQYYPHTYSQAFGTQGLDGILDQELDRARFGLFTFDNLYGLLGLTPTSTQYMVPTATWNANLGNVPLAPGDYSYGNAYPLVFPGCATQYMVNGGARRAHVGAETFGGSLISVGPPNQDIHITNGLVQSALLAMRPYGSTPTGAMLDDLRYYLTHDPDVAHIAVAGGTGDPLQACRARYAILITDGESSDPFRTSLHCDTGVGSMCPYQLPAAIAADLCRWNGSACTGLLNGLFVIAYATGAGATGTGCAVDTDCPAGQACISSRCSAIAPELNTIANNGGTTQAYLAISQATLRTSLTNVLSQANPGTTTRTAPTFALSAGSYAAGTIGATSAPQIQYQMTTGFNVSDPTTSTPWNGTLDRTRYLCDATLTPVAQPLTPTDHFAYDLNARNLVAQPRRLLTVVAPPASEGGIIIGNPPSSLQFPQPVIPGSSVPVTTGTLLQTFDATNANITAAHFGRTGGTPTQNNADRTAIFDYVHGRAPAPRAAARLGDIYHSSPLIVTAPRVDIDDGAYSLFRQVPAVAGRPSIVYVGTNDGVLHAFALEDDQSGMNRWFGGDELWGFVPPSLMPASLYAGLSGHLAMVDGTPIVRDVVYHRAPGDANAPDTFHTVLVAGLRGGGNVYVALEVSDPTQPVFLWQWRDTDMGLTYGRPGLGQVMVDVGAGPEERAIAVLPGGAGVLNAGAALAAGNNGCASSAGSHPTPLPDGVSGTRANRQCWQGTTGRALYVVDVASGELLARFDSTTAGSQIASPMTGGVALYNGETGQMATRAFVADADGVMWRLDMSSPRPSLWTFTPFYDLYWDMQGAQGQPIYEPPVVSVDNQGNPVVVMGSGNIDNLEGALAYRLASVTEMVDHTQNPSPSTGVVNWELRLQPGEQVTAAPVLYANAVYFGTFFSSPDPTNACSYGTSSMWAVDYLNGGGSPVAPYTAGPSGRFPMPMLVNASGSTVLSAQLGGQNTIVTGLGITQRPNCTQGAGVSDQYLGSRYQISNVQPGTFQLVAQVSGTATAVPATQSAVQTVTQALSPPLAQSRMLTYQPAADF
jgi:type IV pilus assembly protein PilY1